MKVTIAKPDASLFEGEASLVQLPGSGGIFEVLPGHAPIISSLKRGSIRLVDIDKQEHTFPIRGGVTKSQKDHLVILVQ